MTKTIEKVILTLLIAALAVIGGTVRFRPKAAETRPESTPASEEQTQEWWADMPSTVPDSPPPESAVPAAPEPTAEPEPEYYSLHFVGDCTLASNVYYQGGPQGYDTVVNGDFSYPFAKTVQYFEDDDFTFANLEVALTESTAAANKTFVFKTHAEYAQILSLGGVEFAGLANNHVLDFGQQGYDDTKAAVAAAGMAYAGRDEWAIYETERGMKIGVYAVSFGTVAQIKAGVEAVREAGADFVIAALHWGDEGSYQVNSEQLTAGHAAVDAGADFVYGSHPHTLQPIEKYNGVYIVYSMGNWTFGGNTNPRDKDTLIYGLTVAQYADGHTEVVDTEIIPCASSGVVDGNNYQPVPYEPGSEEYDRVLSKLNGSFEGQNLSISYGYGPNE